MAAPIMAAIQQIAQEKGISVESVVATIESALAAAFRKDFGQKNQNIKVEFDGKTGGSRVFDVKTVVEDELAAKAEEEARLAEEAKARGEELPAREYKEYVEGEEEELHFNPKLHITLTDAREIKSDAELNDEIRVELQVPEAYGRMAAQTAKQVIIQRLREAERATVFDEFKDKQGKVLTGVVQRREPQAVFIDLGRAVGLLPTEEQIERERYSIGERLKVYILSVEMGSKGPEIILSRRSQEVVRELFSIEIPEVANGSIEIKSIAREAGARSKVAVFTEESNIDPIGSCVGQRGARVQTIISELGGEKIDIIEWSENPVEFVSHSLLPAKVLGVEINEQEKEAVVTVESEQLSLAIGRQGQNVRLAAHLTGYKINIVEFRDGQKRVLSEEEIAQGLAAEAAKVAAEVKEETEDKVEEKVEAPAKKAKEAPETTEEITKPKKSKKTKSSKS
ncbi:MAG: transcription termination factor NusA [Patescibacteria group bacterium]